MCLIWVHCATVNTHTNIHVCKPNCGYKQMWTEHDGAFCFSLLVDNQDASCEKCTLAHSHNEDAGRGAQHLAGLFPHACLSACDLLILLELGHGLIEWLLSSSAPRLPLKPGHTEMQFHSTVFVLLQTIPALPPTPQSLISNVDSTSWSHPLMWLNSPN